MERRKARLGSNKKRLSDAPSRDLWLRDRSSGDLAALRHDGFPPLACPRPASSQWQCPVLGPDGNPSSLRVCACEAQPRTPHPTGLGYPAPAKLSLCPTSVTPLEAPLTGQDGSDNKPASGDGDKEYEKIFSPAITTACPGRSAAWSTCGTVRCRAGAPVTRCSKKPGSRFCEAARRALHRARDTSTVLTLRGSRRPPSRSSR